MRLLSGNPQNILIGSFAPIGYLEFSLALAPIAIISLALQIGILCLLYPEVRSRQASLYLPQLRFRLLRPLLKKTLVITLGLLIAFTAGVPMGKAALTAAALLLITRRVKPEKVLRQVDWNLLVMFSGLFILTHATQTLGWLEFVTPLANTPAKLLGVTAMLSNLISNVPAVLVLAPIIEKNDLSSWLLLSAGSTFSRKFDLVWFGC